MLVTLDFVKQLPGYVEPCVAIPAPAPGPAEVSVNSKGLLTLDHLSINIYYLGVQSSDDSNTAPN